MSEDRRRRIERLYQAALALRPDQRAAFLDEDCGDPGLRRELETLLASKPLSLLNRPAWEATDEETLPAPASEISMLGPYRMGPIIGKGGMGEVYRAHDAKLNRDVAIKILPAAFADDLERLSRFQREARVLASLNHPHIAAIYGFEDSRQTPALVMELVGGPTLADRIRQGPIPVDEALSIARQMADALEYAHEKGIVHRDLKPANVKLGRNDAVKILDFGLAKALEDGIGSDGASSPTITEAKTEAGVVMGTAAYMSPEQARGKAVDRRTDIWAFGCLLYEMLTGRRAFRGEGVTETLAAVIHGEPEWSLLPAATSPLVVALLRRCLQKDVRQRLQAIGDARVLLEEVLSGAAVSETPSVRTARWKVALALGLAAVVIALAAGLVTWNLKPAPAPVRTVHRETISLPAGQRLAGMMVAKQKPILALSPDEKYLAYVATAQGEDARQIYLWSFEQGMAQPVSGSVGADTPFFSADGQWLGFYNGQNAIMKIPVRGGVPEKMIEVNDPYGGSWAGEHNIAVASLGSGLRVLSDDGRTWRPLTVFDEGETQHVHPEFLPDGKSLLFGVISSLQEGIAVQNLGSSEHRILIEGKKVMPRYSPSGHLIYAQDGSLMAAPFNPTRLEVEKQGVPSQVMAGVLQVGGVAQFSVSASGSLAYIPGAYQLDNAYELVRVSRDGTVLKTLKGASPRPFMYPRVSSDGQRLAVDVRDDSLQVWLFDLGTNLLSPLTYKNEADNRHAAWLGSEAIVYQSGREGVRQLFSKRPDGGGLKQLTHFPAPLSDEIDTYTFPSSVCHNDVALVRLIPTSELWVLHLGESGGQERLERLDLPHSADGGPEFSPDCHWLAYALDESGHREIWLAAYPSLDKRRPIITDGNEPKWNPDPSKRELFYRRGRDMMAVKVNDQGSTDGEPEKLFTGPFATTEGGWVHPNYDVFPDGSLLMLEPVEQQPVTQINIILGWSEELKRLAPTHAN